MSSPKVVLYGASGYTGKHVAWKLAQKKIPFIAAGRNKQRLQDQLAATPELKGAEYEVVAVDHDEDTLTRLLDGKTVVHNLVGPYMQLGKPVLHAALRAGCHYMDCTGEQDWMYMVKAEYSKKFADKGLALMPATSAQWNLGLITAEYVLETPGIDTLDIAYLCGGVPSVASTLSFMRMCCQPQYFLHNKQRAQWPVEGFSIAMPGMHQIQIALPWSGGGEPVWFEDDARVLSCKTLVTFGNNQLMNLLVARMQEFTRDYKDKPVAEQEAATNRWAMEIAPQGEPPRENLDIHRAFISCHGRGQTVASSIGIPGVAIGYMGSGTIGAYVIDTLLRGQQRKIGFAPAAHVVGVRPLHAELIAHGVLGEPVKLLR